ncbi:GPW/gp25 family protein [Microcystis sp. LEGE 08355]|uniref:GPW/gp25 family protein n=1 Tax=Microcystis sp. LEGE 08355 TaxID=1828687 RepID=UPI00188076EE|nr:GPW/gp25 family protein [Microcystis sp. LEGE 08355]MBE9071036.1 GPW/gp25 family protein [Microcystis sp. LEGE 08355]
MQIAFPFKLNNQGLVATTDYNQHIYQMIEQILFTMPGERVNLPSFGCGLQRLVFTTNNTEMVAVTQAMVQAALSQWLGDVIQVATVEVKNEESKVTIWIEYAVLITQERYRVKFEC